MMSLTPVHEEQPSGGSPFQPLRVEITVANVGRLLHHAHLVLTKSDSHCLAEALAGRGDPAGDLAPARRENAPPPA